MKIFKIFIYKIFQFNLLLLKLINILKKILLIFLYFIFFNFSNIYCIEIESQFLHATNNVNNNLLVLGISLLTFSIGCGIYYLYNRSFNTNTNTNNIQSIELNNNINDENSIESNDEKSVDENSIESNDENSIELNDLINQNTISNDSIILSPVNNDILQLGYNQLVNIKYLFVQNQLSLQKLHLLSSLQKSVISNNDELTKVISCLSSIEKQNVEIQSLLENINSLYLVYLGGT